MKYYKFTSISTRSIVSILTGKFWASSLNNMNDPFEDRFNDSITKEIIKNCGVFCMSGVELQGRNILKEPLMWAHYADNHEGIAIGLVPDMKNPVPFKVEYLPHEEIEHQISRLLNDFKGKREKVISPWQDILFKYKPIFWEYENEYRQVFAGGANMYVHPLANINEIVFGFRTKPEEEIAIWSLLKEKVNYKKVNNQNGILEIKPYIPPKEIITTEKIVLLMNKFGEDINKYESGQSIDKRMHKYE